MSDSNATTPKLPAWKEFGSGTTYESLREGRETVTELPPDFGESPRCVYELYAIVRKAEVEKAGAERAEETEVEKDENLFCTLDPTIHGTETFDALKKMGCEFLYYSTDHGVYWDSSGKHQRLYDALYRCVPWSGYPKFEMYEEKMAQAICVVYLLSRIQQEWFNNGFGNVDPYHVRDVLDRNLKYDDFDTLTQKAMETTIGYDYFRMIKYLADYHHIPSAVAIVDDYQEYHDDSDEIREEPPSNIAYNTDDEYDSADDSVYDDDLAHDINEENYRKRRRKWMTDFYERVEKEKEEVSSRLEKALTIHAEQLGADVMELVRSLLTPEDIILLERSVPDPAGQAAFNRLGVCIRPGLYDDQQYKYGQFKRATREEEEREAKRMEQVKLFDESEAARQSSQAATKRLLEIEKEEKREQEEYERKKQKNEDERNKLRESIASFDAEVASKREQAKAMSVDVSIL